MRRLVCALGQDPNNGEQWPVPELHVWFNIEEVLEANAPWFTRSSLEHEASKLGMEDGSAFSSPDPY
jgi:hypothetical protein